MNKDILKHKSNHLSEVSLETFSTINKTRKVIKTRKICSSHIKINLRILKNTEEIFGRNKLLTDVNRTMAAFLSRISAVVYSHL